MSQLFSVFEMPSTLVGQGVTVEKYKSSPLFDVKTGEFVVDGGGELLYGNGYDAWVLWCCKTISTQRMAHLAYRDAIGVEMVEAFQEPDRAEQESAIERTVTEALLADPKGRTLRVYNFNYEWYGEEVGISCTVLGENGDTASISTKTK